MQKFDLRGDIEMTQ